MLITHLSQLLQRKNGNKRQYFIIRTWAINNCKWIKLSDSGRFFWVSQALLIRVRLETVAGFWRHFVVKSHRRPCLRIKIKNVTLETVRDVTESELSVSYFNSLKKVASTTFWVTKHHTVWRVSSSTKGISVSTKIFYLNSRFLPK